MAPQAKPATTFRRRGMQAAVWKNQTKDNEVRFNVTLSKRYKDKNGDEWKSASSLDWDDLQRARKVLDRADDWIEAQYDSDSLEEA